MTLISSFLEVSISMQISRFAACWPPIHAIFNLGRQFSFSSPLSHGYSWSALVHNSLTFQAIFLSSDLFLPMNMELWNNSE